MKLHVQCMYNTLWCEQHETLKYRCIQWLRSGQPTKTIFDLPLSLPFQNWWFHWEHCWKYHRKCCINLNYSCLRKCLKCPSLNLSKWLPHTSHHHHRHFSPSSKLANCCPVARGGEGWAGLNNRQLLYCTMYNIIALFSIAELYMRNILYSCITES